MRQPKHIYNSRYRAKPKGKAAQARARRNYQCKNKYGITLAERERMWQNQKGLCGVCGNPLPREVMTNACDLDHNHVTGQLRALLHRKCNLIIGFIERNPNIVPLAITYLNDYKRD